MKKLISYFLLVIPLAFFMAGTGHAQILYNSDNCTYYHQDNCPIPDFSFYYNGQSKSALFKRGQTSELRIVVYEGEDYFISVCAPRKWQPVHFRILEDDADRTVLFDNERQGFIDTVKFKNEVTKRLIIEVTAPQLPEDDDKTDPEEKKCIGVLIASRRSEKSGFVTEEEEKTGF